MRQSGGHFLSGRVISVWPKQKISPALRIARDGSEHGSVRSFTARGAAPQVHQEDLMKDGLNHVVRVAPLLPPKRRKMRRWGTTQEQEDEQENRRGRRGWASTDHSGGVVMDSI